MKYVKNIGDSIHNMYKYCKIFFIKTMLNLYELQ